MCDFAEFSVMEGEAVPMDSEAIESEAVIPRAVSTTGEAGRRCVVGGEKSKERFSSCFEICLFQSSIVALDRSLILLAYAVTPYDVGVQSHIEGSRARTQVGKLGARRNFCLRSWSFIWYKQFTESSVWLAGRFCRNSRRSSGI
jgi:hypothetical protein